MWACRLRRVSTLMTDRAYASGQADWHFAQVLASLSCGILLFDQHQTLVHANGAFYRLFPDFADEREVFTRLCAAVLEPECLRQLRDNAPAEAALALRDGRTLQFEVSVLPEGQLWQLSDVTEALGTRQLLRQRMTLFALLPKIDQGLSRALDVEQVLAAALDGALQLSGVQDVMIGVVEGSRMVCVRAAGRFRHLSSPDLSDPIIEQMIRTGETQLIAGNGRGSPSQLALPVISHEHLLGAILLETAESFSPVVVEFLQLMTNHVAAALGNAHLHELLQAQVSELRALERLKSDIIRVASHDIRSPLVVVGGYLDVLHDDLQPHLNAEHESFFDAIRIALSRIHHLATSLLSLERVQALKNRPESIVGIDMLVDKAALDVRDLFRLKRQQLQVIKPSEPLAVYGFDTYLNEALNNLLINASKYTPEGGIITLRVFRADTENGSLVVLNVEDNGIGIAEADQARLFQPFYRVKNEATHAIDGTGLGLYLVKKIVEYHGGEVRFTSVPGKGSTFGFQIPCFEVEHD